jgi:hypothetical protein
MSEKPSSFDVLCPAVFDGDVITLLRRLLQAGMNVNASL